MKTANVVLTTMLLVFFTLTTYGDDLNARIKKYSPRSSELIRMMHKQDENGRYAEAILQASSPEDLATLTPEYLEENIVYALKARDFGFCDFYDEDVFVHYVLPPRMAQEPWELWRKSFFTEIAPLVSDAADIREAAVRVNLWVLEKMTFKPTSSRDQGPLTTIRRGYGRCEESMILFMAAARSVGIPVRAAYAPFWNFMDNNHAWVEVYTPGGWEFAGEAENGLSRTWFNKAAGRAALVLSEAFGSVDDPDAIRSDGYATLINSTAIYTSVSQRMFNVTDGYGNPAADAKIRLYALSYGGLFPVLSLTTDARGIASAELGRGPLLAAATAEGSTGFVLADSLSAEPCHIVLHADGIGESGYEMRFPHVSDEKSVPGEKVMDDILFSLLRKNADLKRRLEEKERFRTIEFAEIFDRVYADGDEDVFGHRKLFLEKCTELGENTGMFLDVLGEPEYAKLCMELIFNRDAKDLCEIRDREQLVQILRTYAAARERFSDQVTYRMFIENVMKSTEGPFSFPETGWRKEALETIRVKKADSLSHAAEEIIKSVKKNIRIEERPFYYFSCHMDPVQLLKMRYVRKDQIPGIVDAFLTLYGIPTRWKGRLEYYDGSQFVPVTAGDDDVPDDFLSGEFSLEIEADGKKITPEPWGNFIVQYMDGDGALKYAYFDGENEDDVFKGEFSVPRTGHVFVSSYLRNGNGDAFLSVNPLQPGAALRITQKRLPEPFDLGGAVSDRLRAMLPESLKGRAGLTVVFYSDGDVSEPEIRLAQALADALPEDVYLAVANPLKRVNSVLRPLKPELFFFSAEETKGALPAVLILYNGKTAYYTEGYRTGMENIFRYIMKEK